MLSVFNAGTSLVEQYTTVDKYFRAGRFDPKFCVNCLQLSTTLSTVGYCSTSEVSVSLASNCEPLQYYGLRQASVKANHN